jgi:hypothetical protein
LEAVPSCRKRIRVHILYANERREAGEGQSRGPAGRVDGEAVRSGRFIYESEEGKEFEPMRFPIGDAQMQYVCGTAPQPVKDFQSGGQKASEDGEPLFSVGVLAMANGEAEMVSVKVAGQIPVGVVPGAALKVVGLVVMHWSIDGKSGMAFRRSRVEPLVPAHASNGAGEKAGRS